MRLDTTGAGTLAEGGAPEAPATLRPEPAGRPLTRSEPLVRAPRRPPARPPLAGLESLDGPLRRLAERPAAAFTVVAFAVLGFSQGWPGGIVLDGPGVTLYLQMAVDHLQHSGGVPYWMPEMWAGSPVWALAPSFPTMSLVPLAILVGADGAVKIATLAAQIVGGWGTFVLARSLWGKRTLIPVTAALLYALHPLFLSHGPLFGHETSVWVMAVTPWLAWTLRRALQEGGRRYAVVSGLLGGVAILQQAEHAYGLALLCGLQLAIELTRTRRPGSATLSPGQVLGQAATVVVVVFGVIAFWLLPFLALSDAFVLTPPEAVRAALAEGIGSLLGREPGTFLIRSESLQGTVSFNRDLLRGNFYLGWVCLIPTFATALLVSRRDDDGHLTAVLLAGGVGVWLSTAGVSLAESGPAQRAELLPFLVIGGVTGLLVGNFLRRLTSGRAAVVWGVAAALLLLGLPYSPPFLALQRVIPFLSSIRFPRFYPVAALGIALGAVYPLRYLAQWAGRRRAQLAGPLTIAAALALLGAFLIDVHPYQSFYRVHPPDREAAYEQMARSLAEVGGDFRIATAQFGDPGLAASLLDAGHDLSVGWPHPIAGKQVWRLTGEAMISPPGYKEAALALSATAYLAEDQVVDPGRPTERVRAVQLDRNPSALPLVRSYGSAVVVRDGSITPELAVSLAARNVAVVRGDDEEARLLGEVTTGVVDDEDACLGGDNGAEIASEVATACSLHPWIGVFAGFDSVGVGGNAGGVFESITGGLSGVGVWLDRAPGTTELALHEMHDDGRIGDEVARATSGPTDWDDNGLFAFRFPAIEDSAGKRYTFVLSCPRCSPADEPRMVVTKSPRGPGNLAHAGRIRRDRAGAFSLIYADMPEAVRPDTTVQATRTGPGGWRLQVSGTQPALVVVSDAWFPGWKATIDGQPTPVLEADGAFLGVAVGPGDHEIELSYGVPAVATVGRSITAVTFAVLAAGWALSRRRSRAATADPTTNGHVPQPRR
jgi:hypothetical protein